MFDGSGECLYPRRHRLLTQLGELKIHTLYQFLTVLSFQFAHNKMPPCHILKMVNEEGIDDCAPGSADSRYSLSGCFFRDLNAKSFSDHGNKFKQQRCTFVG